MYTLILILAISKASGTAIAIESIPFVTRSACEAARDQLVTNNPRRQAKYQTITYTDAHCVSEE